MMMRIPFKVYADTDVCMYMYVCTVDFACLQYYKVECLAVWRSVIIRHFASGYVIAVALIGFRLAVRSNLDNRHKFQSAKKSHLKWLQLSTLL